MDGDLKEPRAPSNGGSGRDRPHGQGRRGWLARLARALRRPLLAGAGALVVAGFAGFLVFLGFEIGERELFPHEFFQRVDRKLEKTVLPKGPPEQLESQSFATHLIRLDADIGILETGEARAAHPLEEKGGGITSFGPDVLVLPYDGRIYAATSGASIRPTRIVAPDINRAAYEAVADDPAHAALDIRKGYLRYNDLIRFESGVGQGLIASYTEFHPDGMCYTNTLARLDIDAAIVSIDQVEAGPGDWRILYRTEPCLPFKTRYHALEGHMAGGRLAFRPPSTLYMTSGDFHLDGMRSDPGPGIAQDPSAEYGKILAIDIATGEGRIVSIGHRNPQGLVLLPDGRLYDVEHGPRGGDELNLIREGQNYGWPLESFGVTYYGGSRIPGSLSFARHETFEAPVFSWVPSVATSAVALVEGFHPAWDGDLLVGSLIDASLYRLRMAGERIAYSERIEIGARIRDVHEHSDGRIVLWTDNRELIFLTAVDRSNMAAMLERFVETRDLSDRIASRLETALAVCAECHSFEVDDHARAPSLARIHGDQIAATAYEGYSDALRRRDGDWTTENLAAFIRDPQGFAPGTSMPSPALDEAEVIDALVSYLETLDQAF